MLEEIFVSLLNMSITASYVILAVILLRLCLKKAPKWISCALWALVGVRLIIPFSLKSAFCLIPSSKTITTDILYSQTPTISSGIPALNSIVNPIISGSLSAEAGAGVNPMQIVMFVAGIVWIVGVAAMLLYSLITYLKLCRKVFTAMLLKDNVWQCDAVASPFVLGIIKPKIYIPFSVGEENLEYIIAHEQAHIKRKDHWIKPIAALLLAVYWFNPLCWIAYILLCRDIELACDEKIFREIGDEEKKAYSTALLSCAVSRRNIAMCPLAFGEVGVKQRVKNVLNYKKPEFWIIIVAVITCLVMGGGLLLNPSDSTSIDGKIIEEGYVWSAGNRYDISDGLTSSISELVDEFGHSTFESTESRDYVTFRQKFVVVLKTESKLSLSAGVQTFYDYCIYEDGGNYKIVRIRYSKDITEVQKADMKRGFANSDELSKWIQACKAEIENYYYEEQLPTNTLTMLFNAGYENWMKSGKVNLSGYCRDVVMTILSDQKYSEGSAVSDSCDFVFEVCNDSGTAVMEDYYINSLTGEVWLVTEGRNQKCIVPQTQLSELIDIFKTYFQILNYEDALVAGTYSPSGMVYLGAWYNVTPQAFLDGTEGTRITITPDKFEIGIANAANTSFVGTVSYENPQYTYSEAGDYICTYNTESVFDIDISSYNSKSCYIVLAKDGTDTGYRIFCLDGTVWVSHWDWYGSKMDRWWCEYIFSVSGSSISTLGDKDSPERIVIANAPDITVYSGSNSLKVKAITSKNMLKSSWPEVECLDIEFTDDMCPFRIYANGEEKAGMYSIVDAETGKSLDFFMPSGLMPQAYLLQNTESGHSYYVYVTIGYGGFITEKIDGIPTTSDTATATYVFGVRIL